MPCRKDNVYFCPRQYLDNLVNSILLGLTAVLAGTWVGAIIFHSAIVAPGVFRVLDEPSARRFLRDLFPRFFRFGIACGALLIVATAGAAALGSTLAPKLLAAAVAMTVLEVVSLRMVPAINAAKDSGEAGQARFARLHGLNVMLTLLILLIGIVVLFATGSAGGSA